MSPILWWSQPADRRQSLRGRLVDPKAIRLARSLHSRHLHKIITQVLSRLSSTKASIALTDFRRVVNCTKDEFRRSVVARADVWHIWLALQQLLSAAKVAQFQHSRFRIEQQVLRFNVTMTNAQRMDVSETSEQLVHVKLRVQRRIVSS